MKYFQQNHDLRGKQYYLDAIYFHLVVNIIIEEFKSKCYSLFDNSPTHTEN